MKWNNALAIINPRAGRWRSERSAAELLRAAFAQHGGSLTIRTVSGPQDARLWAEDAARDGFDLCIVCGGDGTVHEVINGLLRGTMLPIALLPTGSGNVLTAELGIGKKLRDAVCCIHNGTLRSIDAGMITSHNRMFVNAITLGYGSRIIADARQELKNFLGYPAYVLTALANLTRINTARFRCTIDGSQKTFDAQMVMVANVGLKSLHLPQYGPVISVDDGLLDVILFSHKNIQDLAWFLAGIILPSRLPPAQLTCFRGREITITSNPVLPFLVDGESVVSGEVSIASRPGALRVVAPKDDEQK
ncbi:MAG: diacylglycerol kinase family protein [bacterium]